MKKFKLVITLIIPLTFGFIHGSNAQQQSKGLYLTYNDYINHKLSYTANPKQPNGNKILIHEFMGVGHVTVISNGKKTNMEKSGLFGYHDNYGNDYRFFDNKAYQIIDTSEFCIYSYDRLVQEGKGPKAERQYYFSKNAGAEIFVLTPENIAMVFPQNHKFQYMVEVAAKTDIKLDAYDAGSKEYKIKELYAESLK
jgi:hypothetical protein